MEATKAILMEVDPALWQEAKIQSVRENIPLREFVTRAIRNELEKVATTVK
jgi:hypothetical protein